MPAFFDENQRQATREAGQLAGLTVERIINEPTAASLVYHAGHAERRHLVVYDLGGGTFDVSVVRIEDGVVEVLSSKGDARLGGDDFDQLLSRHVADTFMNQYKVDLMEQSTTRWRLMQACERAKCELSSSLSARISDDNSGDIVRHDVAESPVAESKLSKLVAQAKQMRAKLGQTDAEDVDRLLEQIERAQTEDPAESLTGLEAELDDLLFYLK